MKNIYIAIILILVTIISLVYVFFGNNWLVDKHFRLRERNNEFIKNDLMERLLQIEEQSQRILDEISQQSYSIDLFHSKSINLDVEERYDLGASITSTPVFDYHKFFLVFDNKLAVYQKKSMQLLWEQDFTASIKEIILLDVNRVLVLATDNMVYCLSRTDGSEIWRKECELSVENSQNKSLYQISLDQYKKLDRSVIMICAENSLKILNNISGQELCSYQSNFQIRFVSDFDQISQAIYTVESDQLIKLRFND